MVFIENFIHLFVESAPFLLVGMFLAGVIHQMVPQKLIERTLGKSSSVVTAALIGTPLPLCSCSVIPVAMGIRRSGASKASTASFLVATPETGVDSIGITYALMGPVMAIVRPIAAIFSAISTGVAIRLFAKDSKVEIKRNQAPKSCCSHHKAAPLTFSEKLKQALVFGYGKLLKDFMQWLLIGLFFAALIQTALPAGFLAQYGSGVLAMAVIVLISIPMYICATASTPIAVGLLMSGISPGAALVFMLTGPATNIATLMVIKQELGRKELVIYLTSVIFSAIASGLLVDYLFDKFNWSLDLTAGGHDEMTSLLYSASAFILATLILYQYGKMLIKRTPVNA